MTKKALMAFTIDEDLSLQIRAQITSGERSRLVNDFFRRFLIINEPDKDVEELLRVVERCNKVKEDASNEQAAALAQLAKIKAEQEEKAAAAKLQAEQFRELVERTGAAERFG